ncbi:MAG: universal stress protein, partial [Magnetospirillum sp.]
MSLKDILVHVDDTDRAAVRLDLALGLAGAHQSHLVALNVRTRSVVPSVVTAQLGSGMDVILARGDIEAAAKARSLVDSRPVTAGTSIEWRDVSGDLVDSLSLHARYCDLVV